MNGNYDITANFGEVVTLANLNLEAAVREAISKPEGPINASDLAELTYFYTDLWVISNLTGLGYATRLTVLYLRYNQISDITPLTNLTNLTVLVLGDNQISDISPLANLTKLQQLKFGYNLISDISPLAENEGLSEGDEVYLTGNPLSSDSINVYIPQLEARGVTVYY